MMDTKALIEHLNAARQSLAKGDSEQTLSLVLGVYEAQHFTDELGVALRRIESGEPSAMTELDALLDTLHQRAVSIDAIAPDSLGMSISDFFADVPTPGANAEPVNEPIAEQVNESDGDEEFEMIEIMQDSNSEHAENLDNHFSFADLGGELSFENLDMSFSDDSDVMSDAILEDIWPEDSLAMEDSKAFEDSPVLAVSDDEFDELDDLNALQIPDEPAQTPHPEGAASDPLVNDSPAFEASDAQTFDGFFDELDEQAQWFSADQQDDPSAQDLSEVELDGPSNESSVVDLVEVSHDEISLSLEPGGISGVSETQDGLDVFDIFNQVVVKQDTSNPPQHVEPVESILIGSPEVDPPEPAFSEPAFSEPAFSEPAFSEPAFSEPASSLPLPPPVTTPQIAPSHYEPESSPRLDFSLDFDDSVTVEPEEVPAPEPVHTPEPAQEPLRTPESLSSGVSRHNNTPTVPQEDIDLFDDLFDFDIPAGDVEPSVPEPEPEPDMPPPASAPPATHVQESGPSLGFGDLGFDDEDEPVFAPPQKLAPKPVEIDPPTRQIDVDVLSAQLSGLSEPSATQGGLHAAYDLDDARETRAMPVVDRDLLNPLEQEDDSYFAAPAEDDWSFGDSASGMPGLEDDWLDAPDKGDSPLPAMDPRDVHNDATAIPGLNASNSGLPFNPYQNPGVPRTPSNPPESMKALSAPPTSSSSSSLRQTQEGQVLPVKAMRDTLERDEIIKTPKGPTPSTVEHDYRHGLHPAKPEEESDPFDFDLGLSPPNIQEAARPAPRPMPPVIDTSTETSVSSTMFGIPFAESPAPKPRHNAMPTPLPLPSPPVVQDKDISEDEFFALAESIAAEQSVAILDNSSSSSDIRPYRGEPMMRGEPSRGRLSTMPLKSVVPPIEPPANPFQQQTPTGVRNALVEESSQVSFALEEVEDDELDVGFVPTHLQEDQESLQLERAQSAYDRGHFEDALDMVTPLRTGAYSKEANALLKSIESELERLQLERLGSLTRTPVLDMPLDQLSSFKIDHRAGFLLSQIDGFLTFEDILDLSAMPRLETILVLTDLLDKKVIKSF